MANKKSDQFQELLVDREAIIDEWMEDLAGDEYLSSVPQRDDTDWRREFNEVLGTLETLLKPADKGNATKRWRGAAREISGFSELAVDRGLSAGDTATLLFALKQPLATRVDKLELPAEEEVADARSAVSRTLDRLAVEVMQAFVESRDAVVTAQQEELLELSVPVLTIWQSVLALPIVGTLDSARAQVVMETLLQRVSDTRASVVILDITGVPTVDTLVAQHLIKTISAAGLMGTRCLLSGIRPQIAQTMVQLGIDMEGITTRATLADALDWSIKFVEGKS